MKLSRQLVAQSHKHIFPTFSSYRKFCLSKPLFNGQIDTFFQKVTQGDASSVRSLLVNDKELLKHKYDGVDNQEKVLAFTIAAQNGCYDVLEAMIEADPNLIKMEEEFQRSKDGLSALQQIIANLGEVIMGWKPAPTPLQNMNVDRHRCIYLLVSSGTCDLNFNRSDGWTPLMLASRFGLYHVVSMLIEHGASLTLKAAQGQTALHVAAEFERTPVALLLLSHDASLADVKDHRGDDFFSIVEQDQKDFALKLLSMELKKSTNIGNTEIMMAASKGDLQGMNQFIYTQPEQINQKNIIGWNALIWLLHTIHPELYNNEQYCEFTLRMIRSLLRAGLDVNAPTGYGKVALSCMNIVPTPLSLNITDELLSSDKIDLEAVAYEDRSSPLQVLLSEKPDPRISIKLIDAGADVLYISESDVDAVGVICLTGQEDVFDYVIKNKNIPVEFLSRESKLNDVTNLMAAISEGHVGIAKKLLRLCPNINVHYKNQSGVTILLAALYNFDEELLNMLVERNIDLHTEVESPVRGNALHYAVSIRSYPAVKWLLEQNVSTSHVEGKGYDVLAFAKAVPDYPLKQDVIELIEQYY